MASEQFEAIWVPRIGENATAELWRGWIRSIWLLSGVLVFAVATSFALAAGTALGYVGALAAAAAAVWCMLELRRTRIRLAAVLAEWFGVPLTWKQIPAMRIGRFEAWRARRGLEHKDTAEASPSGALASTKFSDS